MTYLRIIRLMRLILVRSMGSASFFSLPCERHRRLVNDESVESGHAFLSTYLCMLG